MWQRRVRPLCEQRLLICTGCHGAPTSAHGDDEPLDGIPRASPPHQATSVPRPARKLRGGKPRRKTAQSDPATTTTPLRCGCCVKALWCCVLRRRGRSGAGGGRVRRTEQVARGFTSSVAQPPAAPRSFSGGEGTQRRALPGLTEAWTVHAGAVCAGRRTRAYPGRGSSAAKRRRRDRREAAGSSEATTSPSCCNKSRNFCSVGTRTFCSVFINVPGAIAPSH
jgi:hypothetical protein